LISLVRRRVWGSNGGFVGLNGLALQMIEK
jgi:hypothetical protein